MKTLYTDQTHTSTHTRTHTHKLNELKLLMFPFEVPIYTFTYTHWSYMLLFTYLSSDNHVLTHSNWRQLAEIFNRKFSTQTYNRKLWMSYEVRETLSLSFSFLFSQSLVLSRSLHPLIWIIHIVYIALYGCGFDFHLTVRCVNLFIFAKQCTVFEMVTFAYTHTHTHSGWTQWAKREREWGREKS